MPLFTREGAERVAAATEIVERAVKGGGPGRARRWPVGVGSFTHKIAKSGGSGVPALTGTTPGSGLVTLQDFAPTTLTAQSGTVTAYNVSTTAVAANKYLVLAYVDGFWFIVMESC